jgi:hypothetical protein
MLNACGTISPRDPIRIPKKTTPASIITVAIHCITSAEVSVQTTLLLTWRTVSLVTHQDTEEDHACQHHHCCHTLHHTRSSQHRDYTASCVGQNLVINVECMRHNLLQGSNQDTEEDHACQHHHCCHTLHHASTSQHRNYTAARVAQGLSGQYCWHAAQPFLDMQLKLKDRRRLMTTAACSITKLKLRTLLDGVC